MSGRTAHIKSLSDAELYKELTKHGFPAGPVVASTRKLYEHKLSQILEGGHAHGDNQELLERANEMEEQLTETVKTVGSFGNIQWSPRSRSNLSQTYSTYSGDVASGRSGVYQSASYYTPSREQDRDDVRAHSSVSSSYLGTVRGVGNYDDSIKASPSWLSNSSVTQPHTSSSWRTYSSSGDEDLGKPRYRTTLSGTSPAARQEMASRYRLTGFSDENASVWNRRNPERLRNKSLSSKARLGLFIFLVLVAMAFCYVVYNAWHENDPYQQIEQDVVKFTEEMKLEDKQE